MAPWPLAGNRAQTLGALAYAAAESLPAARRRAELASVQKPASAHSGGSLPGRGYGQRRAVSLRPRRTLPWRLDDTTMPLRRDR